MTARGKQQNRSKEVRIAARKYAKSNKPKNINRFITYLHETFKPDTQRKIWIQEIELNNMEKQIRNIFKSSGKN